MNHSRIKRDPKVMFGKPVIVGTRITAVLRRAKAKPESSRIIRR
jgi:uncharacterized protein (DUF433 family)